MNIKITPETVKSSLICSVI